MYTYVHSKCIVQYAEYNLHHACAQELHVSIVIVYEFITSSISIQRDSTLVIYLCHVE